MDNRRRDSVVFESQNKKIFGVLHLPSEKYTKAPGVVIFHGFGGNKCGKHRLYVNIANRLQDVGIAVLRFDFLGSGDSDGDWQDMSVEGEVADAVAAVNLLKSQPSVDGSRIGILGRSFGGYIGVLAAPKCPGIKSLVLWAPVFSANQWQTQWKQMAAKMPSMSKDDSLIWFQGEMTNIKFVKQFFSTHVNESLAKLSSVPLLHIYGDLDTIVSPEHAQDYAKERINAKAPTQFIELKKSDHDFTDPNDQQELLNKTSDWFQKTL